MIEATSISPAILHFQVRRANPQQPNTMANKLLLNYYDAVIYESDLSLLEYPTAWLNDATINFRLTRLQHNNNQHGDRSDGSVGKQSDLFLDPCVQLNHCCGPNENVLL
jgi:hypothetical protein